MKTEPKYKHDCSKCQFLGKFVHLAPSGNANPPKKMVTDLYVCFSGISTGTILVRYTNGSGEYDSLAATAVHSNMMQWLGEPTKYSLPKIQAYIRAIARGLLTGKEAS